jgi:hypothetical protein
MYKLNGTMSEKKEMFNPPHVGTQKKICENSQKRTLVDSQSSTICMGTLDQYTLCDAVL